MKKSHWLKRLIIALLVFGLPWGVLFALFMDSWFSINHCQEHLTLDCFAYHFTHFLQKMSWIHLTGSMFFGFMTWIILELQNKFLIPDMAKEQATEVQAADPAMDSTVALMEISHLAQRYPPSYLASKSPFARNWLVFVDNQQVVSLPQLGTIQVALTPGQHAVFIGFENHKSFWRKAQRSATIAVNLKQGQISAYTLKYNSRLILLSQLGILAFLGLFTTQSIWLYPLLNSVPPAFWDACPVLVEIIQFGLTYQIFAIIIELALISYLFHLSYNKQKLLLLTEVVENQNKSNDEPQIANGK